MLNAPDDCDDEFDLNLVGRAATKMAEEAKEFLLDHGGMSNGYNTWVKGYVSRNESGTLDLCVNDDDLSKKQLAILASKLEDKLKKLIPKDCPPFFKFGFEKQHVEHGCYEICVRFDWSLKISLY